MTAGTHDAFCVAVSAAAVNLCGDGFVAMAARALHDLMVEFRDLDGVGIFAAGEVEGMPESVVGLHCIFPDNVVRSMTVVAGGGVVMARLDPSVILLSHDVAVHAGRRIICQVGIALCVDKSVSAYADEQTEGNGED